MKIKRLEFLLIPLIFLAGCAVNRSYLNQREIIIENVRYSLSQNKLKQESRERKEIKFGVVADIHNKSEISDKAAERFQKEGVDAIIVAGDIVEYFNNPKKIPEKTQIINSLTPFLKTKKPVYVIAGNHETSSAYLETIELLCKEYPNLFDLVTLKYADLKGVNIFSIPGGEDILPIGCFSARDKIKSIDTAVFTLDNDPLLMISHLPPKFNHDWAIDCVCSLKVDEPFTRENKTYKKGEIIKDRHLGEEIIYEGRKFTKINPSSRGLRGLTDLITKENISFSISGHYHMNQGADNLNEKLPQNYFSERLFMNPGACKFDKAAILTINGKQAKYNILELK